MNLTSLTNSGLRLLMNVLVLRPQWICPAPYANVEPLDGPHGRTVSSF